MIDALKPLLDSLGPAALFLVMGVVFAETGLLIGFFLPGDSLLFLAGAFVASDTINVPLWLLMLGVFVAAVAGDQVGYSIGRHFGPRIFSRPNSRIFSQEHAQRAQKFFEEHGTKAVILARFVPLVRTFVPTVAGVGRMPRRLFTIYNVIGAFLWAVGLVGLGYYFGGVPFIADNIEILAVGVVAISVTPALISYLRKRRKRGKTEGMAAAETS
ncbi:MAG: hypothetical protein JWP10_1654 [Nocardioidaceae bacterium]|nr:hypothetical protein [Nocardioidaceae bacterium]